jgi:hypothetical protein
MTRFRERVFIALGRVNTDRIKRVQPVDNMPQRTANKMRLC